MSSDLECNNRFLLRWNRGGLTSLKLKGDIHDTEYIWPGETLGDVVLRYRLGYGPWREAAAFDSGDVRSLVDEEASLHTFRYDGTGQQPRGIRDLQLTEEFVLEQDTLVWKITLRNMMVERLEIGDLGLPLPFNRKFIENNEANYTQCIARHSFISGHGSFIFWERPNGIGPYLVMTPLPGTKLEYYEELDIGRREPQASYWPYIHSGVAGRNETRGTWRQAHTTITLAPKGARGDCITYGFRFQWADDYDGVRMVLYDQGLFDVQVVPGMSVPEDLSVILSLHTRNKIDSIEAEFPSETTIVYLGETRPDTHLYRVRFCRLGENALTVQYGDRQYMLLEFFVTQSLETLIRKRARFLVDKQQHRDPDKWYDGLFSVWDMKNRVLRGPDDTDGFDGWWGYVLACDDTALPKAPFVAAKNVYFPVPAEVEAVEYYIERFVWGKLQRTDQERPYPYGIYGVPNWYTNRHHQDGFGSRGQGLEHVWRSYDYPHLIMLYWHMYQIAKQYPGMTKYLDADGYLERAYGTARAYFEIQGTIDFPRAGYQYWAYTLGIYNELLIVDLIQALYDEGKCEEGDWLKSEWEKKVKYFVYDDPYPFDSEYPFDTTAFESSHAVAAYGLLHTMMPDARLWYNKAKEVWYSHPKVEQEDFQLFLNKQIEANIALRGWLEPAYYLLGSDYRGGTSSRYQLSYMSQMGGWAIVDYALYHATDPAPYLRLGYASCLSSWALMNTGTPETDYGYWFSGQENDGAAGWAFLPEKYGPMWIRKEQGRGAWLYDGEIDLGFSGALRTAATVVIDDPLFGLLAYGGEITQVEYEIGIIPRDGLRRRLHIIQGDWRLHLLLERDGFAAEQPILLSKDLQCLRFVLENRTLDTHTLQIRLAGFSVSNGSVTADGAGYVTVSPQDAGWQTVEMSLPEDPTVMIEMRRIE